MTRDIKPTNKFLLHAVSICYFMFAVSEMIGAIAHKVSSFESILIFDAGSKVMLITSLQISAFGEQIRERANVHEMRSKLSTQVRMPLLVFIFLVAAMSILLYFSLAVILQIEIFRTIYRKQDLNGYFLANFILDIICFSIFWWKGREMFFETPSDEINRIDQAFNLDDSEFGKLDDNIDFSLVSNADENDDFIYLRMRDYLCPTFVTAPSHQLGSSLNKNMNMVSAICHLSFDCIKTFGSLIAGIIALLFDKNLLMCYAWSVICTLIIVFVFIAIPLAKDIILTARELKNNQGLYSKVTDEDDDNVVL